MGRLQRPHHRTQNLLVYSVLRTGQHDKYLLLRELIINPAAVMHACRLTVKSRLRRHFPDLLHVSD